MDKKWVLLYKKFSTRLDKKVLRQKGPYTEDEINWLIEKGKVKYHDYVWTKGFNTWERLSRVEEFKYKIQEVENESVEGLNLDITKKFPLNEELSEERIVTLSELNKKRLEIPEEAETTEDGNDLVQQYQNKKYFHQYTEEVTENIKTNAASSEDSASVTDDTSLPVKEKKEVSFSEEEGLSKKRSNKIKKKKPPKKERTRTKKIIFRNSRMSEFLTFLNPSKSEIKRIVMFSLTLFVISCIVFFGEQIYMEITNHKVVKEIKKIKSIKKIITPKVLVNKTKKIDPVRPQAVTAKKKLNVQVEKTPTYLKTRYIKRKKDLILKLQTDAGNKYRIEYKVEGRLGEILYNRYLSKTGVLYVKNNKSELNLSRLGLSDGRYTINLKLKSLFKESSFFYGNKGAQFKGKMFMYKKALSRSLQLEKRALFFTLSKLEKQVRQWRVSRGRSKIKNYKTALKSWNLSLKNSRYLNRSFYPEIWRKVKEEREKFLSQQRSPDYFENKLRSLRFEMFSQHFWSKI